MKLVVTRICDEVGPGREIGLCSFDMEADGISSHAEIDALINKLTELRAEIIGPMNGDNHQENKAN